MSTFSELVQFDFFIVIIVKLIGLQIMQRLWMASRIV